MATLKLHKMPKAPKAKASIAVKENYLRKVAEVKKANRKIESLNKKSKALDAKIARVRAGK